MAIEIEKKYRLDKHRLAEITKRLQKLGAVFAYEVFEENYLHRGGHLDESRSILRLRKTGDRTVLTYKEKLPDQSDIKHKVEFETNVSDVQATENIIEKLGYRLSVIYEKRRKAWYLEDVEVVLDELPFGFFMEIEGTIARIEKVEKLLKIKDLEPEPRGYPRLTEKHGIQVDGIFESRFSKNNG